MAQGNGHSIPDGLCLDGWAGFMATRPIETSPFNIGGTVIQVPVMRLWEIKRLRPWIDAIVPDMQWLDQSEVILHIVAIQLAPNEPDDANATFTALMKACSMGEMRELVDSYVTLLRASGFILGEPELAQEAASPGTGTSTESPPTSQFEEFAVETPSESFKP